MMKVSLFLMLLLFIACSSRQTGSPRNQRLSDCRMLSLMFAEDSIQKYIGRSWHYSYTISELGCIALSTGENLPTDFNFYKCSPDTLWGEPKKHSDEYYKFLGWCFDSFDNGRIVDNNYALIREMSDGSEILFYGRHFKGEFTLKKIDKDTLVVDFPYTFSDSLGNKISRATHVYLSQ